MKWAQLYAPSPPPLRASTPPEPEPEAGGRQPGESSAIRASWATPTQALAITTVSAAVAYICGIGAHEKR